MRVVHKEHRDTRLNEDISKIVNIVIEHIPIKTFTLVLYGGYGRNEGGFFFDIDTILPYNDYDVLIITERTLDELTINKITRKVLNDINIKWFDLSVKNLRELQNLRNSIWSYDLKNGSKVIYGNKEILKLVDNFNPSEIPLIEILTLFRTRMYTIIGSMDNLLFENGISGEKSRFFRYQMAKAILAIVDVELLMNKQYTHSYKDRCNRYFVLNGNTEFQKLVDWALFEKMNPSAPPMLFEECHDLLRKVTIKFKETFYTAFEYIYRRKLSNADELMFALIWSKSNIFNLVYEFIRTLRISHSKQVLYLTRIQSEYLDQLSAYYKCDYDDEKVLEGSERCKLKIVDKIRRNILKEIR